MNANHGRYYCRYYCLHGATSMPHEIPSAHSEQTEKDTLNVIQTISLFLRLLSRMPEMHSPGFI